MANRTRQSGQGLRPQPAPYPAPKPKTPSPNTAAGAALFAQAAKYANAAGVGTGDASASLFINALDDGVAPADALQWFKDYIDRLRSVGRTLYDEDTMQHSAGQSLADYFWGREHGKNYGDSFTTTADDVRKFIQHLRALEAGTWADIKAGTLTRETSNLDDIEQKLRAAGLQPTGGKS